MDAHKIVISEKRMLKLKRLLVSELPTHNRETLHFLAQHLNRVAAHEEVNKVRAEFDASVTVKFVDLEINIIPWVKALREDDYAIKITH